MKKTLYLFLSLLLCFALFACTQEPSTTPNEIETATPEVTPNEVETVTPNEPDEIIPETPAEPAEPEVPAESETPTEPEVPTEPETPIEPEVPTEPDKNVVMLPEADENTIKYTLELPEDFVFEPYTNVYALQNIVDHDEFDFGDNALRIEYSLPNVPYETSLRLFTAIAYIGNGIHSLDEGKEAYNRYWGIEEQPYYDVYNQEPPFVVEPEVEVEVIDYDIIGKDILYDVPIFNGKPRNYNNALIMQCRHINGIYNKEKEIYTFHSPDMSKMLYEITVPADFFNDENKSLSMEILQIVDEKHILVEFSGGYIYEYENKAFMPFFCTYLLDLESNKWQHIMPFAFNAVFSPDGKYFAYSTGTTYNPFDFDESYLKGKDPIEGGYYIKEMETGKTVLYRSKKDIYRPFDWISADVLK